MATHGSLTIEKFLIANSKDCRSFNFPKPAKIKIPPMMSLISNSIGSTFDSSQTGSLLINHNILITK
jgi:hypothetical protein